jgi:hypothetical protein
MTIEMLVNVNMAVDQLLQTRREIERLKKEEEALKKEILAMKVDDVEGYHCRAVITHVAESTSIDFKAVCAFLKVEKRVLDRFPKTKAAYDVVNIRPL